MKNIVSYTWRKGVGPVLYFRIENKKYRFCFCHRDTVRSITFLGIENIYAVDVQGFSQEDQWLCFCYHFSLEITIVLAVPIFQTGLPNFLILERVIIFAVANGDHVCSKCELYWNIFMSRKKRESFEECAGCLGCIGIPLYFCFGVWSTRYHFG